MVEKIDAQLEAAVISYSKTLKTGNLQMWTGGNDISVEGNFTWENSGTH